MSSGWSKGMRSRSTSRAGTPSPKRQGTPSKRTGAIYDLQAPTAFPSSPIGQWNEYVIEASGPTIKVTLNRQLVNTFVSDHRRQGFLALQAHHFTFASAACPPSPPLVRLVASLLTLEGRDAVRARAARRRG